MGYEESTVKLANSNGTVEALTWSTEESAADVSMFDAAAPIASSPSLSTRSGVMSQTPVKVLAEMKATDRSSIQPILSDIIIYPRHRRKRCANNSSLVRSLSQPVSFVDVDIDGSPLLPRGRHRVWNGDESSAPLIYDESSRVPHSNTNRAIAPVYIGTTPSTSCVITEEAPATRFGTANGHYGTHHSEESYRSKWRARLEQLHFFWALPRVAHSYLLLGLNISITLYHAQEMTQKALQCRESYERNKCHPEQRVPALEALCNEWQGCIAAEMAAAGGARRAALSAETAAQVINAFLEQLSWKSAMILSVGFATLIVCGNLLLVLVRAAFRKTQEDLSSSSSGETSSGCHNNQNNHICTHCSAMILPPSTSKSTAILTDCTSHSSESFW